MNTRNELLQKTAERTVNLRTKYGAAAMSFYHDLEILPSDYDVNEALDRLQDLRSPDWEKAIGEKRLIKANEVSIMSQDIRTICFLLKRGASSSFIMRQAVGIELARLKYYGNEVVKRVSRLRP